MPLSGSAPSDSGRCRFSVGFDLVAWSAHSLEFARVYGISACLPGRREVDDVVDLVGIADAARVVELALAMVTLEYFGPGLAPCPCAALPPCHQ